MQVATKGQISFSDAAYLILVDNKSTYDLSLEPKNTEQSRHWFVCFRWLRDAQLLGMVRVAWIKGEHNLADVLTKPHGPTTFEKWAPFFHQSGWMSEYIIEKLKEHMTKENQKVEYHPSEEELRDLEDL